MGGAGDATNNGAFHVLVPFRGFIYPKRKCFHVEMVKKALTLQTTVSFTLVIASFLVQVGEDNNEKIINE